MEGTAPDYSFIEVYPLEVWHQILSYFHHWRYLHLKRVCKIFDAYISNFHHDITDMHKLRKLVDCEKYIHEKTRMMNSSSLESPLPSPTKISRNKVTERQEPDLTLRVAVRGDQSAKFIAMLCGELITDAEGNESGTFQMKCNDDITVDFQFNSGDIQNLSAKGNYYKYDLNVVLIDTLKNASFIEICNLFGDPSMWQYHRGMFMVVGWKPDPDKDRQVDVLPCKAVPRYLEISATTEEHIERLISKILDYLSFKLIKAPHERMLLQALAEAESSNYEQPNFEKALLVRNFTWRFMKKSELMFLSRDFFFRISFVGPEKEIKALIRAIQIHGPCASSHGSEANTYVLFETKSIVQLNLAYLDPQNDNGPGLIDLIMYAYSVNDHGSFRESLDPCSGPAPHFKSCVGLVPDGEFERKVFTSETLSEEVCPSTYQNVDNFVTKILRILLSKITFPEPPATLEEHWIDFAEAPKLDENDATIAQYQKIVQASLRSDKLKQNVTWCRMCLDGGHRNFSVEAKLLGAPNVPITSVISKMMSKGIPGNILTVNTVIVTTVLLCFNIDDIESFLFFDNPAWVYTHHRVLFVGIRSSTTLESNRQVFLQHLSNTTEQYIEVCVDEPESIDQLISKIIYLNTGSIDFHREITQKELDEAFEGVLEEDTENSE